MSYANSKNIPYIFIAGEEEIGSGTVTVKNMSNGEQEKLGVDGLENWCKKINTI